MSQRLRPSQDRRAGSRSAAISSLQAQYLHPRHWTTERYLVSTTAKAIALAHELADRLKNRKAISALTIVESFDTDQNPLIALGTQASSDSAAFLIKIEPVSWPLAQDIL